MCEVTALKNYDIRYCDIRKIILFKWFIAMNSLLFYILILGIYNVIVSTEKNGKNDAGYFSLLSQHASEGQFGILCEKG